MAASNHDGKDLLRIEGLKTYFHTDAVHRLGGPVVRVLLKLDILCQSYQP